MNESCQTSTVSNEKIELEIFKDVFDEVVDVACQSSTLVSDNSASVKEAMSWFRKVLEYNVPHGKMNRGLAVVHTYLLLKTSRNNPLDVHKARMLGWCVEMLQAYFLVADDIMDKGLVRRGQPCWYLRPKVGMIAVNDSFFIESTITLVLKAYLRDLPCYIDLIELFEDVKRTTIIGQNMDTCAPLKLSEKNGMESFTMELYDSIAYSKTAIYSFYLPVALAMHLAGKNEERKLKVAKDVLLKIGHFFQVQDDFLDCFGDVATVGKIGTDIQDGKCTWLIVKALELANSEQKLILQQNYGSEEESKVNAVKKVFDQLQINKVYSDYEEETYKELMTYIDSNITELPKEIFTDLMKKLFKRQR